VKQTLRELRQDDDVYKITSLNLTEFTPNYIVLNVTFEHPNSITPQVLTPDYLVAKILNVEFFIDYLDFQRVKNETALIKGLKPQLTVDQQDKIKKLE
jgi:hypothetical protein